MRGNNDSSQRALARVHNALAEVNRAHAGPFAVCMAHANVFAGLIEIE